MKTEKKQLMGQPIQRTCGRNGIAWAEISVHWTLDGREKLTPTCVSG
jgi:hypothetical protein